MPRKRAEFDRKLVRTLASFGCTQEEIAEAVGISETTLKARARAEIDSGYAEMRRSLRKWQYNLAKQGNLGMLIWLGKQYLGQREKTDAVVREEVITIEEIAPKVLHDA
jgi:transcriptional regulator with XRE-family HTH domain